MTMKRSLSLLAVLLLMGASFPVQAADQPHSIAFRLSEWRSLHFDHAAEAQQQLQTLKQLGCEAQATQHAGHVDVKFRAAKWTKVTLETDALADQWEKWLKTTGFETLHGHAEAPAESAIAVHYITQQARRMHLDNPDQAREMTAIFAGLGCTVEQAQHSGHIDLTVSCPSWHNLVFETHDEAHAIQTWLDEQGFQTQHNH
jgi:hypothetical protein